MLQLNLKGVLHSKGISIGAISALLGLHRNTVASKLNGETAFTVGEALKIKNNLCPEYDLAYLFELSAKKD